LLHFALDLGATQTPPLDPRIRLPCRTVRTPELPPPFAGARLGESGRTNLRRAAAALRRLGWASFWIQLVLVAVSIVISVFSVAFTRETSQNLTLGFALFGIACGMISVFWAFGYTRLSRTLYRRGAGRVSGGRVTLRQRFSCCLPNLPSSPPLLRPQLPGLSRVHDRRLRGRLQRPRAHA